MGRPMRGLLLFFLSRALGDTGVRWADTRILQGKDFGVGDVKVDKGMDEAAAVLQCTSKYY